MSANEKPIEELTAEEVAASFPVGHDESVCDSRESTSGYRFYCTRAKGHAGFHVAYGGSELPYAIWNEEGNAKLLFKD